MVKGDAKLVRMLLSNPKSMRTQMCIAASGEAKALVQLGFRTETDPDGQPWTPLAKRKGKILRKTARMANSFTSEPTESGFRVGTNVEYAQYHQGGTKGHSKSFSRFQLVDKSGKFVNAHGKARSGGRMRTRTIAGVRQLNFREGQGGIPARPMVPPNGVLTPKWQEAIDKSVNAAMRRMARQSGAK